MGILTKRELMKALSDSNLSDDTEVMIAESVDGHRKYFDIELVSTIENPILIYKEGTLYHTREEGNDSN